MCGLEGTVSQRLIVRALVIIYLQTDILLVHDLCFCQNVRIYEVEPPTFTMSRLRGWI